jgi:hypothetical protein
MISVKLWQLNVRMSVLRREIFNKRARLACLYMAYALNPFAK